MIKMCSERAPFSFTLDKFTPRRIYVAAVIYRAAVRFTQYALSEMKGKTGENEELSLHFRWNCLHKKLLLLQSCFLNFFFVSSLSLSSSMCRAKKSWGNESKKKEKLSLSSYCCSSQRKYLHAIMLFKQVITFYVLKLSSTMAAAQEHDVASSWRIFYDATVQFMNLSFVTSFYFTRKVFFMIKVMMFAFYPRFWYWFEEGRRGEMRESGKKAFVFGFIFKESDDELFWALTCNAAQTFTLFGDFTDEI